MTHGVIGKFLAADVWDVMTTRGDGIAVYGADLAWNDERVTPLRVRAAGEVESEKYARYEPVFGEPNQGLIKAIVGHGTTVGVPSGTSDLEAMALVAEVASLEFVRGAFLVYAEGNELGTWRGTRRLGKYLERWSVRQRWCCVYSFLGRDGPDVFATESEEVRDALLEAMKGEGYGW